MTQLLQAQLSQLTRQQVLYLTSNSPIFTTTVMPKQLFASLNPYRQVPVGALPKGLHHLPRMATPFSM